MTDYERYMARIRGEILPDDEEQQDYFRRELEDIDALIDSKPVGYFGDPVRVGDEWDMTEIYGNAQKALDEIRWGNRSENISEISPPDSVEILPLTVIEPQPVSVIERIKSLGNEAVYVLQDLLLDPAVSDRVRLDAVKAVIAIVEAEKNKEISAVSEKAADLDELENIIRSGGFDL